MKGTWATFIGIILLLGAIAAGAGARADAPLPMAVTELKEGWRHVAGQLPAPEAAPALIDEAKPVSLPHIWEDDFGAGPTGSYGVATYIRHISLSAPASQYGLKTGKQRTVYRLYAVTRDQDGGAQVYDLGGNGQPGVNSEQGAAGRLFYVDLPFDATEFDLVVQVSNHIFPSAGFLWAPKIGPKAVLSKTHDIQISAAFLVTGFFFAVGFLTMLLSAWHTAGRYYYIGGGMLIVMAARTLLVDNYIWVIWPWLDLECALRAEYVGLLLLAPAYLWLVAELYPKESSRTLVQMVWTLCGLGLLVALFAPLPVMFRMRDPYLVVSFLVLAKIFHVFWVANRKRLPGSKWALWGGVVAVLGVGLDTYLYIPVPRTSFETVPFAALVFTFVLLGLFTVRYRQEQDEKAFLSKCLEKANAELKDRAEKLDLAQAEAAAALDLKNSFLSNLSSEIQTPLRTLVSFTERLTDQVGGISAPERTEYLRLIRSNSANLSKLMEDVLSVSDLESGRFEVSPEPTDPKEVADEVLAFVESVAHEKHILIDLKCDEAVMTIDRRLMRQALIKIVSNAVKFSPVNGVVTIRGSKAGPDFVFTVMDTGPGMAPGQISVAMSLLGGADKAKGLGLGLPLVARFMDLVGGSIQIDSIPDLGTTVTLSFPMTPQQS
ncbi:MULTISPECIES: sensor histidine kinase [Kordiimonas]|uniref:sensor histidine kinase n=1 Tax=Kordiimonas TaxID=288021 RepID=UPI00257D4152|nr:ATP-binding protein [Kordiimonas sp. UBA4487]